MLTRSDRFRLGAKDLEFRLPPRLCRTAAPLFGIRNPYNVRDIELKAIFLHVPKTAGSSIRKAVWNRKAYHIPASRYYAYDQDLFCSSFKFCIVRNPWSRVYSAYHYLSQKSEKRSKFRDHRWANEYLSHTNDFESFILNLDDDNYCMSIKKYIHFRDQLDWISVWDKSLKANTRIKMDYIGRYENLAESFETISSRLGVQTELPVLREGSGADYRGAYTSQMIDVVSKVYKRDIKMLRYSFGER